jgi:putative ABC transport system permease protein
VRLPRACREAGGTGGARGGRPPSRAAPAARSADGPALRRLVLLQGTATAAAGLNAGLAAAFLGSRFLASILYGIEPSDPPTYFIVAVLLASTALLACYLPARRAARIDPGSGPPY